MLERKRELNDKFHEDLKPPIKDNFRKEVDRFINRRENFEKLGKWNDKVFQKELNRCPLEDRFNKRVLPIEIIPGTIEALSEFLGKEPQKSEKGYYRYLLTSGLAVEVITSVQRYHHDLDLVLLDLFNGWWLKYGTDNVTPDRYWAEMSFDKKHLEESAWTAKIEVTDGEKSVATVHPAIILVQKLSDAWGKPPRERDIKDVEEILNYWQRLQNKDPSWHSVMELAIAALPKTEQIRTRERLSQRPHP